MNRVKISYKKLTRPFFEGNFDYRTFEAKLKKEWDNLGCEILKEVLEALDKK